MRCDEFQLLVVRPNQLLGTTPEHYAQVLERFLQTEFGNLWGLQFKVEHRNVALKTLHGKVVTL